MSALPTEWRPLPVETLKGELAGCDGWALAGGCAVARITDKDTRAHGDIDIGVFRTELETCLGVLGRERVFLCIDGKHVAWTGGPVPAAVHDIWITDRAGEFWVLQVMVYDDEGDRVIYRRDRRISWAKRDHAIEVGGLRVLNPLVTVLFKTNKAAMEDKEVHDVMALIAHAARSQGHIAR